MDLQWNNHIKGIVHSMLARQAVPRWATIDTVNPYDATAKVAIQPDNVITGYLPISCVAAGGAHIMALPSHGDQVLVIPDCGDAEHGIVTLVAHGGTNVPPISPATGRQAQSGEVLIMVGPLYWHMVPASNGGPATIYTGGGDLVHDGAILATGDVIAGFGTGDQVSQQGHTHGYRPGDGDATQTEQATAGS